MTHIAERPSQSRNPEQSRQQNIGRDRNAGARILNRVDVNRPGVKPEREMSLTDQLRKGTQDAVLGHRDRVRELFAKKGVNFEMNAANVRSMYISQKRRLQDQDITDDMTQKQLTYELMAKAVMFAPQVSEALRTRRSYKSKETLSQYNDIIAEIIESSPAKMPPGYKTAIVETLRLESAGLNKSIGHSSEISGKDPESGIVELVRCMNGASLENAPKRAISSDPRLEVTVPKPEDYKGVNLDLKGIDMTVARPEDGKVIDIDTKARGKYLSTVAELQGVDKVDESIVGPYYYTGIHNITGRPHYLLNANSFSQIPADNFDFTPAGQEKVRRIVHQMLDQ
jgi:hypothetical protein